MLNTTQLVIGDCCEVERQSTAVKRQRVITRTSIDTGKGRVTDPDDVVPFCSIEDICFPLAVENVVTLAAHHHVG